MFISKFSNSFLKGLLLQVLVFGFSQNIFAQFSVLSNKSPVTTGQRVIIPNEYNVFQVNNTLLKSQLNSAYNETETSIYTTNSTVKLPLPDGSIKVFKIVESSIYEEELQRKFPEFKSYSVIDPESKLIRGRLNISPYGFHGTIRTENDIIYIDPYSFQNTEYVISYYRSDYTESLNNNSQFSCGQNAIPTPQPTLPTIENTSELPLPTLPIGSDLRTFRLAVATTGEYTTFHGGTVPQAFAAITTTVNRVNEVYENDLSVRFILVSNTNLLIETNAATDPYSNGTTNLMINESQTEITALIGSANFDIGHLFGTNSGGLAGLGVVCNNFQKARGVTGSASPVGDLFDIDYVCHEIGHQFGGTHTQNNTTCNRSAISAYEPGSGSTIMGYANICPPNLQSASDAFFNTFSIDQIENVIDGVTCFQTVNFSNTPPTAIVGTSGFKIPISTPFELTGNATDANGDVLTYNWEEHDLGPGSLNLAELNNPTGTAPIFRSWMPTTSKTRVFPRIESLINNTTVVGELLPTYTRDLNFRFTVRDNHVGSGGYHYANIQFSSDDSGGPFLVSTPNGGESIAEYSMTTVTWDVANTDLPIFNTPNVDIYLSLDGGLTYPTLLAQNEPNNGSATFQMPLNILPTGTTQLSTCRIKIKSSTNIFFDISNANFTITEPTTADFALETSQTTIDICSPDSSIFDIDVISVLGFSEDITLTTTNLPGDATLTFSTNPVVPGNTITAEFNPNTVAEGNYSFTVTGTSTSGITHNIPLNVNVATSSPDSTELTSPPNLATNVPFTPQHQWTTISNASQYHIQISKDSLFTDIVRSDSTMTNSWSTTTPYESNIQYFWRVRVINGCGISSWSDTNRFTTSIDNPVSGCTDPNAINYNAAANIDDGSCIAPILGCTNPDATNYDPLANSDDGSCIVEGCTNPTANNYNPAATNDDGSCVIYGCTDSTAVNYNNEATINDGSCIPTVLGCTNVNSFNYNALANSDDGTCIEYVFGCTDSTASNYNSNANVHNNSCTYPNSGCTDPTANNYDASATVNDGSCSHEDFWLTYTIENDTNYRFVINKVASTPYVNTHWTAGDGSPTIIGSEIYEHYYLNDGTYHVQAINYTTLTGAYVYVDSMIEVALRGCTDPYSSNFNQNAFYDDGSCMPHIFGCMNPIASNYNSNATLDNNSCLIEGCTDSTAFNFNSEATVDNGSCIPTVVGCTDSTAFNYNAAANSDDGSCVEIIEGCTDPLAFNYNEDANTDDGSCEAIVYGCTDINALNYNNLANTDDGTCEIDPDIDPIWAVTMTSENHTILIPDSVIIELNGNSIENGDLIGVFYDKEGSLQCAGKIVWDGSSTTITAYGDDYPVDNGFEDTEEFIWKIWDDNAQTTYTVQAEYIMTLPKNKNYYDDGVSGVSKLSAGDIQNINITEGWNLISTNIAPYNNSLASVFSNNTSEIELIKDETGQVYWPEYSIDNIGNITIGKAYKVYADNDFTLEVSGNQLNPSIYPLMLNQGWSYLGYLRNQPANIISVLGSISSDLFIIKNINGDVYWPQFGINSIGNMVPGEGYQINMTNSSTFTFPSNSSVLPSLKTLNTILENKEFTSVQKSSDHMHIAVPIAAWDFNISKEDEIGVFNTDNNLVGSAVYNQHNLSITIFGNKEMNGLDLEFKYWNAKSKNYNDLVINNEKLLLYKKDDVQIINSIRLRKSIENNTNLFINQTETSLSATIETETKDIYTLSILNVMGQEISSQTVEIAEGKSVIEFDKSNLPQGIYILNFDSKTQNFSKKFSIK